MGKLKQHFHDEIAASEPHDPGPFPLPPVHVLMERNTVDGTSRPVGVYTHLHDANTDLAILNAGRYIYACSQDLTYTIVESVPCHG